MAPQLEIACFNLESVRIAANSGAHRIEFCHAIEVGGTSPSFEEVRQIKKFLKIPLYIMIRPRGGNFVFSPSEFDQMKMEIEHFKSLNVDGFVFGILEADHSIDVKKNADLIALASPLPCTFHRAFDQTKNLSKSLESLIECGFSTLLTSAGEANVVNGVEGLRNLIELAKNRIQIMPGGGVRSGNIEQLIKSCSASFYHSSAIVDDSDIVDANEIKSLKHILMDLS